MASILECNLNLLLEMPFFDKTICGYLICSAPDLVLLFPLRVLSILSFLPHGIWPKEGCGLWLKPFPASIKELNQWLMMFIFIFFLKGIEPQISPQKPCFGSNVRVFPHISRTGSSFSFMLSFFLTGHPLFSFWFNSFMDSNSKICSPQPKSQFSQLKPSFGRSSVLRGKTTTF